MDLQQHESITAIMTIISAVFGKPEDKNAIKSIISECKTLIKRGKK